MINNRIGFGPLEQFEALDLGKASLLLNDGFASISFFSTTVIILLKPNVVGPILPLMSNKRQKNGRSTIPQMVQQDGGGSHNKFFSLPLSVHKTIVSSI